MQHHNSIATKHSHSEELAMLSISQATEEADNNFCHQAQTAERLARRSLSGGITGQGTAPFPPAVWLNAHQEFTRTRLGIYVNNTNLGLL
jgi:hypothetical protein